MSSVYDYTFNNITRIRQDDCDKSQTNIQNMNHATYMLDRFNPSSPSSNFVEFGTENNMIYTGGHQIAQGGSNINSNSKLLRGVISKPKCKITLIERPYMTVPYLGRGKRNIATESDILQGNLQTNKKSINPSSEIDYGGLHYTPLLPSVKTTITNPRNLVEGAAHKDWVRGGVASRFLHEEH